METEKLDILRDSAAEQELIKVQFTLWGEKFRFFISEKLRSQAFYVVIAAGIVRSKARFLFGDEKPRFFSPFF